jgi:hypothetical protein
MSGPSDKAVYVVDYDLESDSNLTVSFSSSLIGIYHIR